MARPFDSPAAFRQALEQRLKNLAIERGTPLETLRLKLLIERLLARLFSSADSTWLLKGGYAMELRYRPNARTTKDIDLAVGIGDAAIEPAIRLAQIRDQLQAAADIDLGDYLTFRIAQARTELPGAPLGGGRFPVEARMAGRVFGRFHVDVGVGDTSYGSPDKLQGEDLLAFAGIAPAQALAIPKAQQFAEKIHAYTYPWGDRVNTRTKDLVDLLLLLECESPDPQDVRNALTATFATRKTHGVPAALPLPPETWSDDFATMAAQVQLSVRDLQQGFETLSCYWNQHCGDLSSG